METAEKTIESTEEGGAVSMSPSTSLLEARYNELCDLHIRRFAYNMKHDDDAAFAEIVLKDALFQALFGDASNYVNKQKENSAC
jgi:hypothetical protein